MRLHEWDYEYTVWDYTDNKPVGPVFDTLDAAEAHCWYEHKYGPWAGIHDFGIRRRPKNIEWEEF